MEGLNRPSGVSIKQWNKAKEIYESAKRQGDRFPELTVAQAALETGWFRSPSGKNNYFGQKASKKEDGSNILTREVSENKEYKTYQKFKNYNSLDEAVADRISKWSSK